MKSVKTYLIVVSVLLLLALAALIYVWYVYQTVQSPIIESFSLIPELDRTSPTVVPDTVVDIDEVSPSAPLEEEFVIADQDTGDVPPSSVVTIDATTLSDTERSVLASFGYKGDIITIPNTVIACAEESVGEARFAEILKGSAPTPFELFVLSPCLK